MKVPMSNSSLALSSTPPQVEALMKSNLPPTHKVTAIRAFWDRTMAKEAASAKPPVTVATVASQGALVLRGELVGGSVGGLLGYLESRLGSLDVGANKDIPLDGLLAAAGIAGAMMLSGSELATEARHTAVAATAVLSARKTKKHFDESKGTGTSSATHGDGDPLLKWFRDL
jgi:hypothetical protein